jgi:hypothetical protein
MCQIWCTCVQIRGRLTIQEGRGKGAAYRGITHATLSVIREVPLPM